MMNQKKYLNKNALRCRREQKAESDKISVEGRSIKDNGEQ